MKNGKKTAIFNPIEKFGRNFCQPLSHKNGENMADRPNADNIVIQESPELDMSTASTAENPPARGLWTAILVCALLFLLPFKFGYTAGLISVPYFPLNLNEIIFYNWPLQLFTLLSGIAFICAIFSCGTNALFELRNPACKIFYLINALVLVSLFGMVNASQNDVLILQLTHIFSFAPLAGALYLLISQSPRYTKFILTTIAAAVVLEFVAAIYQQFWGFNQTRQFLAEQLASGAIHNQKIVDAMMTKLRVYGSFANSNLLGCFVVMTLPPALWQIGKFARNFEPAKLSIGIFSSLYLVAAMAILFFCGSRGSLLALLIMGFAAILLLPIHKKVKIMFTLVFLCGVVGGFFVLQHFGRGLQTMYLRFDYYQAALKMFRDNLFFGSGWNDFFYDYMKLKHLLEIDEAPRVPHNLLLSFAAHAGICGFLSALLLFVYPMWLLMKKIRQEWKTPRLSTAPWRTIVCFLGLTGFWAQAQTEMVLQSPALMLYAIALMLVGCSQFGVSAEKKPTPQNKIIIVLPILTLLGALLSGGYGVYVEQKFNALYAVASMEGKTPEELWKTNPDEVVMRFRDYKSAAPCSSSAYLLTGDFFLQRGDFNQAEIYFKGALRNAPGNGVIYRRLAQIAARRNDKKSAVEYIDMALATYPSDKVFNQVKQEINRQFAPDELASPVPKQ